MKQFIQNFYPNWLVYHVCDITPLQLKAQNIQGILLDVDNTILGWNEQEVPQKICDWIKQLDSENIKVVLISNNRKSRIETIARQLNKGCVYSAKKPFKKGIAKGIALLNVPKENVAIIGDQLFTDVLGGTLLNVKTILVKSASYSDMLPTKLIRYVEKIALKNMKIKHHLEWRQGLGK